MIMQHTNSRRAALLASTFAVPLVFLSGVALAQSTDIGTVDVKNQGTGSLPVSAPNAVGSKAPPGSAPALSPSQGSLESFQPGSIVSDKVLRDMIPASSDYNEAAKYTPNFLSTNTNGLLGDSKSGWRGYADGQFNITFDGIPFGDANDPTHHSAAYFPSAFIGSQIIDRGPGAASQVGYATFGGTMALRSIDLSDKFGGSIDTSYGSFNTFTSSLTLQTGLIQGTGVRGLIQYSHANTSGALIYGKVNQDQFLGKVEEKAGNFKLTVFATYGQEQYNNVSAITYPQWQQYGKRYGAVNANPLTQQFADFNNSQKATDMEYVKLEGDFGSWRFENTLYTYSYWYPQLQNNGNDQTVEGLITATNGAVTGVTVPTLTNPKPSTKTPILGVASTDVVGFIKNNNYRAYGNIFKGEHDFEAGMFSGTLRAGLWVEHVDNTRLQEYIDYTKYQTFPALGNSLATSYKLDLSSHITNIQPFVEYDWRPIEGLTITPGFKYESFTRNHNALVNQTTLQPLNYSATYNAALPFLAVKYKVSDQVTVYAQASEGFLAPTVSAYYVFNPAQGGIQAQRTTNFQAGAVYKNDKITADADAYIITASNFPIVTNLASGQQIYQNGGTAQYRGVEAEGTYAVMNGWSLYASGALISAKYIQGQFTGMRVGDAPDYTAAFGAIYDDGMFFGSLMQRFIGDAYGSNGQKANTTTTAANLNYVQGYNTTDLVIGFRTSPRHDFGLNNQMKVRLGIYNIFDHRNTVGVSGDPTGVNSLNNTKLTYSFLPGRTIMGSVGISF
jgi:iron complex outermembrane receptor protein